MSSTPLVMRTTSQSPSPRQSSRSILAAEFSGPTRRQEKTAGVIGAWRDLGRAGARGTNRFTAGLIPGLRSIICRLPNWSDTVTTTGRLVW
jgi:hypothetical protein